MSIVTKLVVKLLLLVLPLRTNSLPIKDFAKIIKNSREDMKEGDMSLTTNIHYPYGDKVVEVSVSHSKSKLYADSIIIDSNKLNPVEIIVMEAYRVKTLSYLEKKLNE